MPINSNFWFGWLPPNHPPTIGWIDDDELGEIHELLWRGYAPEPFDRHEWDFGAGGFGNPNPAAKPWRSRRQVEADRQEQLRQYREYDRRHQDDLERWRQEASDRDYVKVHRFLFHWGSLCFVCDRCHGRFTSHVSEGQAELDYLKAFAGRIVPENERLVLCEGCFGVLTSSGGGNASNPA